MFYPNWDDFSRIQKLACLDLTLALHLPKSVRNFKNRSSVKLYFTACSGQCLPCSKITEEKD